MGIAYLVSANNGNPPPGFPTIPTGTDAQTNFSTGAGTPPATGNLNDKYLDTTNDILYICTTASVLPTSTSAAVIAVWTAVSEAPVVI